jgi:hypothetical protein
MRANGQFPRLDRVLGATDRPPPSLPSLLPLEVALDEYDELLDCTGVVA